MAIRGANSEPKRSTIKTRSEPYGPIAQPSLRASLKQRMRRVETAQAQDEMVLAGDMFTHHVRSFRTNA